VAIKLHRCGNEWVKLAAHPCWKVQKALDEQGIEYELAKGPGRKGKRDELERLSGQRKYPVIEFEDGHAYRAESGEMAAKIRSGQLFAEAGPGGSGGSPPAVADGEAGEQLRS
jgi:glutaredoxin